MGTPRQPGPAPTDTIPDKLYFKIGEVADLVGVQTHVLRYWEKEVSSIKPTKSASNQRRYRRKDVEIFREIRRLLYEERYTLAGARKRLTGRSVSAEDMQPAEPVEAKQMDLGLVKDEAVGVANVDVEKIDRVREGLRDLIRLAGEAP